MNHRRSPGSVLSLAAEATLVWLDHNLVQQLRSSPALPRAMHFISTHRCNARCVMCGIWKETGTREQELSPKELDGLLTDRLFSKMEYVGISGGEPFVRDDLTEICRVVLRRCSRIKRLSLTTNGLLTRRMSDDLPEIAEAASAAGALLDVSVSVHGIGETLDAIYGVEGSFAQVERTIDVLTRLRADSRLSFSMNCVLLARNLAEVPDLRAWAAQRSVPLSFVIGEHRPRFRTDGLDDAFVDGDEQGELIDFLRELAEDPSQTAVSADKYREIVAILEGRKTRSMSCYYAMGGLVLGHEGRLYYCSHSKEIGDCLDRPPAEIYFDEENLGYRERALLQAECLHCPPYTRTRWEIEKDLPRTLVETLRRRLTHSNRGS
jgi:MoaA/NifB/PqqE/SkfB family radical SAM enzyme